MIKNEKGFTLIEMLIVLSIITVLIILIVPTLANKSGEVQDTGCEALVQTVQSQVAAYQLEKSKKPQSIEILVQEDFITDKQKQCRNGKDLELKEKNGKLIVGLKDGN